MLRILRSSLSKLKFRLGLNPRIVRNNENFNFIPAPFKSVVLFYADFELAWAWRYSKEFCNKKDEIKKNALRERKNVPEIIKLCEKYEIPVTWATVGHLFLDRCEKKDGLAHPDILRNNYFENDYWKFDKGDWFDEDPCGNYKDDPEWYCPDLIDLILKSKTKQEIGCHTFSHIDCRDSVCSSEVFETELNKCKELSGKLNIDLKSFVHPGHTIGNLDSLKKLGFSSYRTDYGNILGYPSKEANGLWEIKGTMEIAYRKKWDVNYNIEFYKTIVDRAIKNNLLCVFWFHPSFDTKCTEEIMPALFEYINLKKEDIRAMTVTDYIYTIEKLF